MAGVASIMLPMSRRLARSLSLPDRGMLLCFRGLAGLGLWPLD
jgi:hypothetical protein